jgi:DNA-binding NarL/FixJ family response regulator
MHGTRTKAGARDRAAARRVLIADPDPAARRLIRDALGANGLAVAATAVDGVQAVELTRHYRPELVLLEAELPRKSGVEATREIVAALPETRVLMLAADDSEQVQLDALRAGASGFLAKRTEIDRLARACTTVLDGEAAISRATTMRLIERLRELPEAGIGMRPVRSPLTPREWEVFDMIAQGLDTRAIAERLVLSTDTVYCHVKHLFRKLGVHSRTEAVRMASRLRTASNGVPPARSERHPAALS